MSVHCMVDLETLSTQPFATIAAIGAVLFDPVGCGIVHSCHFSLVDIDSCIELGARVDQGTMLWWMDEPQTTARRLIYDPRGKRESVSSALTNFACWCIAHNVEHIWSHGLTFDVAILLHYFNLLKLKWPTHWRYVNDTRTLWRLVPDAVLNDDNDDLPEGLPPQELTKLPKHHPIFDCYVQARKVQSALHYLSMRGATLEGFLS